MEHYYASKTKREILVFIVVKPRSSIEPLRLERTLRYQGLPKLPLGEAKTLWLVCLIAYVRTGLFSYLN
ncbi:MAG: hypothetical protein MJE68_25180 [Proteobacteria bacterium]|nr:hypothetical protein [Pseudomonadota bacterium]